jgi:hypothetical protein
MRGSSESAEYQGAVQDLETAYKAGVRAFAEWFAREWLMTRDEWVKSYAEPPPSDEWFKGQNAGVLSVIGALDSFFGDFHP